MTTTQAATAGGNGYDPALVKDLIRRYESFGEEIESEKGSYMATCRALRERMKNILEEGNNRGVPRKALKHILAERKAKRKLAALHADLDLDERDKVELLRDALGGLVDLPLGEAALRAVGDEAGVKITVEPSEKKKRGRPKKAKPDDEVVLPQFSGDNPVSAEDAEAANFGGEASDPFPNGDEPDEESLGTVEALHEASAAGDAHIARVLEDMASSKAAKANGAVAEEATA